jgi:hypothetical protein
MFPAEIIALMDEIACEIFEKRGFYVKNEIDIEGD